MTRSYEGVPEELWPFYARGIRKWIDNATPEQIEEALAGQYGFSKELSAATIAEINDDRSHIDLPAETI